LDLRAASYLRELYGSVTVATEMQNLGTISELDGVDAVVLSPSISESTSTLFRNAKVGTVATGNGAVWKNLGLALTFGQTVASSAVVFDSPSSRVVNFDPTTATYKPFNASTLSYVRGMIFNFLFLYFFTRFLCSNGAFGPFPHLDGDQDFGYIVEKGVVTETGLIAPRRRATFGLFSTPTLTPSNDLLGVFNFSIWYTAKADRIEPVSINFIMMASSEQSIRIRYQAITVRTVVVDLIHQRMFFI
jgi:hypothetical protein